MSSADGTTGSIKWAARVTGDGIGTAGDVRATAESGATSTLTFSYSGMGWVHGSLTVDREDLTTSTGGQTGRTYGDLVTFEIRRTAGAGNVTIDGICMACSP
jgi:glutamine cyclotransferase